MTLFDEDHRMAKRKSEIPANYYLGTTLGFEAQFQVLIFTAAQYTSVTTCDINSKD